jgi:pimeloyl-ACP methyl ester carboxylesterase
MLQDFSPSEMPPDPDEVEGYLARLRMPGRARAASAICRRLVLPELARVAGGRYRHAAMTTPTLVLAGSEDRSFPPAMLEDLMRTAEPYLDSGEFGTIVGAAHYVAQEQPEELVRHIRRFFTGVPAGN